jgi:hypothetical protein
MMLTCREATRLASERLDHKLPALERMGLWLHLAMCRHCKAFVRQLRFLRDAVRRHGDAALETGQEQLPEEARDRIKRALESGR